MSTTIDEEIIETADGAFLSAMEPKYLGELRLEPFSLMRQSVALSLGCSDKREDAFFDAIVMIWLCSLSEDEVLDAKIDKRKALKDAFKWGDSRGYSMVNYEPLLKLYTRLSAEIRQSINAVSSGNGTEEKNDGGQRAS